MTESTAKRTNETMTAKANSPKGIVCARRQAHPDHNIRFATLLSYVLVAGALTAILPAIAFSARPAHAANEISVASSPASSSPQGAGGDGGVGTGNGNGQGKGNGKGQGGGNGGGGGGGGDNGGGAGDNGGGGGDNGGGGGNNSGGNNGGGPDFGQDDLASDMIDGISMGAGDSVDGVPTVQQIFALPTTAIVSADEELELIKNGWSQSN